MNSGAEPSRPGTGAVPRALFIYLILIWLTLGWTELEAYGSGFKYLIAACLLAGFPLCIVLARRLTPSATGFLGAAARPLTAAAGAMALPLTALCLSHAADSGQELELDGHKIVAASLVEAIEASDPADGLRLRIRGLTLTPADLAVSDLELARAELLVDTTLHPGVGGKDLLVKARLVGSSDGRLVWSTEYRVDAGDIRAVRRILLRALSEGMSRTCEGGPASEGQLI
ncbi:MAG: hypothetical protein PVG91_00275 [Gammaproteobacteria bacterium]